MKFKRTVLAVSIAAAVVTLSGCGGGGGGGGGGYTNPYLRTEVPYYTPQKVATMDPLVGSSYLEVQMSAHVANISGSGQDVIVAGRSTVPGMDPNWHDSRITMYSWSNGTLVDKTAQWFPGGIDVITGTEHNVKFADFFKSGKVDMFIAPYTDGVLADSGPGYVYTNKGTYFSRQSIVANGASVHGSTIADVNNDSYLDLVMLDHNGGANTTIAINDKINSFKTYTASTSVKMGGSDVAAADFLGNNTTTFITTDNSSINGNAQKLWGMIINGSDQLVFNEIAILPTSRFNLPKWQSLGVTDSHNIRVVAYDFSGDSLADAIVFSQIGNLSSTSSITDKGAYSEIQFLKNNGSGSFTDVTDTILVGYNTTSRTTYVPRFIDLNGDGLTDILVSGGGQAQFLLRSSDGKYVAAYQNILTDFFTQVKNLSGSDNNSNTVNVVQAPDGKSYLVTTSTYLTSSGDRHLSVYLSALGTTGTISAQTAVNLIQQKWPYMSAVQANETLARTTATYLNGVPVIDESSILSPIGSLSIPSVMGLKPIIGYIAGVKLDGSASGVTVLDEARRNFTVNLHSMSVNTANLWGRNTEFVDQHQITSHSEYLINSGTYSAPYGMRVGADPKNFTLGTPSVPVGKNWTINGQYTSLSFNPWIQIGGAWGSVNSTTITEVVATYREDNFVGQTGLLYAGTNISPGLVTKINNMAGVWAEAGYQWRNHKGYGLGIYGGVKPVMISGGVEAKLPTGVDTQGNIVYTNKKFAVQNPINSYVRMVYTGEISRQMSYTLGGTVIDNGNYRAQAILNMRF